MVKRSTFGWQPAQRGPAPRPPERSGWVERAYGPRAAQLITELAATMRAADSESLIPRTEDPAPGPAGTARRSLHEDLVELRNITLVTTVSPDDEDRDVHLRAALSVAIGAASSLAGASHRQPTKGYLGVAKPAIDDVLIAAGEPIVG